MIKNGLFLLTVFLSTLIVGGCRNKKTNEASKTRIDNDGMLVINGKRTFIIGTYSLPKTTFPFNDLAANGYNYVKVNGNAKDLDSAACHGLMTWIATGSVKNQEDKARIASLVSNLKKHPSLLCWEMEDEPAFTWNSAEPRIKPEPLVETYRLIKQNDPEHLVTTNHGPVNLISTLQKYNPSTDIVSCDIYPVIPHGIKPDYALHPDGLQGDLLNTSLSQVGDYVEKMKRVVNGSKPVFIVLQGFAWEMLKPADKRDTAMVRYPTYGESRFMVYNAIVHGATGVIFWGTDYTPQPSSFMTNLNRITRELSEIQRIISNKSDEMSIGLDYQELGYSVDKGIEFIVKQSDGKLYLITGNSDKNPVKMTFSNLIGYKTAHVLHENRTIGLNDGKLTDTYVPFDVHIYELTN